MSGRGRFARWAVPTFFVAFAITSAELTWWTVFNLRNVQHELQRAGDTLHRDASLVRGLLTAAGAEAAARGEDPGAARTHMRARLRPLFNDLTLQDDDAVLPRPESVATLSAVARAHTRMFVAEGSFFAAMMVLGAGLIFRALRHEIALVRQGQNFLAAVTHELKSPLASMRLWLETLVRRPLGAQALARTYAILLGDVERLETLVANVLTTASLDNTDAGAGKGVKPSSAAALELVATAFTVVHKMRAQAEDKKVCLAFHPPGEGGALWARIDVAAFELVVRNLVDNAIKYSAGAQEVDIALDSAEMQVRLTVTDRGIGLDPSERQPIFDKFYRVGDEMVRMSQGTGLGLYLVRRVVEACGGTVEAHSPGLGKGTSFVVCLPAAPAAA